MPRNIELKVPFTLTPHRMAALDRLGAVVTATLRQTDTYFHCNTGRLKLRQIAEISADGCERASAELIGYRRADDAGFRGSDYVVSRVHDAATLLACLSGSLGVRCVVRKRRDLLLWHNVRIHLDDVEGLGAFLEFEAVVDPLDGGAFANADVSNERLATLCDALWIDPSQAIAGSYSDMVAG